MKSVTAGDGVAAVGPRPPSWPAAGAARHERDNRMVLEDVQFVYPNGTEAVRSLDLSVPWGRTISIVGPSGCGKSTLLAMLAGLAEPTSGTIRRASGEGPGASRMPPWIRSGTRLATTMVFQQDTLLPWLRARDQVALYATFGHADRGATREWVDSLLSMVGLTAAADAYPYEMSGGMRRRVAFLTAVAPLPEVLLLDEPFASLDEPTRVAVHQQVAEILARYEITAILVTHDLAEALSLSDEVVILTNRPARVAARHSVPFGPNRNIIELRQQNVFLELYGRLWSELAQQIGSSDRDTE
jgi:NitT/TauT family transport system ATP-binding protein